MEDCQDDTSVKRRAEVFLLGRGFLLKSRHVDDKANKKERESDAESAENPRQRLLGWIEHTMARALTVAHIVKLKIEDRGEIAAVSGRTAEDKQGGSERKEMIGD